MRRMSRVMRWAVVVLAALNVPAFAQADYPNRPVRVIVPFAPGGVVDVMARLLTQKLSETMGKNFYVDNIGGAGGNIGTARAAAAEKDGYTIEVTSSSFVVNPSLQAKVPYDPLRDFTPVSIAAASPNVVVVDPQEASNTLAELVSAIKAKPTSYSFGHAGIGTTPHLSGELFRLSAGLNLVHVPFRSAGQALQSVAGGQTPIAFSGLPPAVPLIKSGTVKALAVTSENRVPVLPDVPTLSELGFKGQEAETLLFVLAPAGTPKEIVDRLSEELRKILGQDDIKRQFDGLGFEPMATTPEQSSQRMREEIAKWAKVIKDSGLKAAE